MSVLIALCDCGGSLNEKIDFSKLVELISREDTVVKKYSCLCLENDLKSLVDSVLNSNPEAIVVAGCSKRVISPVIENAFKEAGLREKPFEVANIREHCAWVHQDIELATVKASKIINSSIEKALRANGFKFKKVKVEERALVIGGGIAGIQAALDLAYQGFRVYLVEKTPTIGGVMALLVKTFPTDDCAICIEGPKMAEVFNHPNVEVLTYAEVEEVERIPQGFKVRIVKKPRYVDYDKCTGCGICAEKCPVKVPNEWDGGLGYRKAIYIPFPQALPRKYTIDPEHCLYLTKGVCRVCERVCSAKAPNFNQKPEELEVVVGSIIVAVGFSEYDPSGDERYGFGKYKDVITQLQLARILDPSGPTNGKLVRLSDGRKPKRIVMIQCVGSRDPQTNIYCSRYCCMAAMKNAMIIKIEQDPEADITIIHKDVRAAGKGFEEYYLRAVDRFGVKFVKGEVLGVFEEGGELTVKFRDELGEERSIKADLIVLSAAMTPPRDAAKLAEKLGLELDEYGFFKELDSKVATVETSVPGVFICGCAQGPKDIPESVAHASSAAGLAAIHMKGERELLVKAPKVLDDYCSKCGLCQSVCPFNAVKVGEGGVVIDELVCQGCCLCSSICPNNALKASLTSYEVISNQLSSTLSGLSGFPKPITILFCCDECAYTTLDTLGFMRKSYPESILPIIVPCLSSVSIKHVINAFRLGADAVILMGCLEDRCHFKSGSIRADHQVSYLNGLLRDLGLDKRIKVLKVAGTMTEEFLREVKDLFGEAGGVRVEREA